MSSIADGPSDVWHAVIRTARKAHTCCACDREISPGHRYALTTSIYDGTVSTWKRCGRCETIFRHLVERSRDQYDDTWPDGWLNCGHDYIDAWGEDPPPEIAALAFATPDEASALLEGKS